MPKKSIFSEKIVKEVLEASGGFISIASKKLNCPPITLYKYLDRTPAVKEHLQQIRESYLDLSEAKLIELVKAGNLGAICFYLKCQGKARGWIERQEITGKDGRDLNIGVIILPEIKSMENVIVNDNQKMIEIKNYIDDTNIQ